MEGFFVTFEGGEGVGKSTLIDALYKELSIEFSVSRTREPGSTKVGEEIRNLVLHYYDGEVSPLCELCLYLASRAQHIKEVILPALLDKKIILCDRFNDTSIVYQGYARGLGMDEVEKFCQFISNNLKPSLTFFLDIDPKIALKRVGSFDRMEGEDLEFHNKVREGYHILAKREQRFFIIDAEKKREEILEIAIKEIRKRIC